MSNDYEQLQIMSKRGQTVVILDHHLAPYASKSKNIITVNNQLSPRYKNKALSGAGIVYRFCQAYDDAIFSGYSAFILDLVALGNLSDVMDYRSLETRYIIHKGLESVHNSFFYYMVEKNEYSIANKGGVNYNSVAWYVTPFINAVIRSGTQDEKMLVFESMLISKDNEKIPSGKRGHKGELVPRVDEAIRVACNVKARQSKLVDASMERLQKKIENEHLLDNKILLCLCEPGEVEPNLAGLVANKLQALYQRPTLVLTKHKIANQNKYVYQGSARNYDKTSIADLRQLCEDTGVVEFAQGHQSAFGIEISEDQIPEFVRITNEKYADVPTETIYWVDYIWQPDEDFGSHIYDISKMNDFWGTGIPEAKVVVENILLETQQIELMSKDKRPTLKIVLPNGVNVIKFNSSEEEFQEWTKPNKTLTIVGTPNINRWNGNITPQILVDDYEIKEKWVF